MFMFLNFFLFVVSSIILIVIVFVFMISVNCVLGLYSSFVAFVVYEFGISFCVLLFYSFYVCVLFELLCVD